MHILIDKKERLNYNENHILTSWAKIVILAALKIIGFLNTMLFCTHYVLTILKAWRFLFFLFSTFI
jgi:hypothetical protein